MIECPFRVHIGAAVYKDPNQRAVTFEPLNPVTPCHRLVVSTCHARSPLSYHVVSGAAMEFAVLVAKNPGIEQYNFITSTRTAATQTGEHLHIHIVPRREDDGLHLPSTGQVRQEVTR